jgi:hypothetical protein
VRSPRPLQAKEGALQISPLWGGAPLLGHELHALGLPPRPQLRHVSRAEGRARAAVPGAVGRAAL